MNSVWAVALVAYLLGSIPFGYLIVKLRRGQDVRGQGSGNIGATNVARVAGAGAGISTLALDVAKGYLAVWLAERWSGGDIRWMMLAAVSAIVGHMFPIWLRFRGGKGVATGLGVFLPISGLAVLGATIVWIIVVSFWRYVSLGSIAAAAALPIFVFALYAPGFAPPRDVSLGTVLVAVLVIAKHRENIQRIISGKENRLSLRR